MVLSRRECSEGEGEKGRGWRGEEGRGGEENYERVDEICMYVEPSTVVWG